MEQQKLFSHHLDLKERNKRKLEKKRAENFTSSAGPKKMSGPKNPLLVKCS